MARRPLLALCLVLAGRAVAQVDGRSPAELVDYLTHQSERSGNVYVQAGLFSCGWKMAEAGAASAAATALTRYGESAVPYIEAAFDPPKDGSPTFPDNAELLLAAYAHLRGHDAYPWLKAKSSDPAWADFSAAVDQAIAVALGLTSYVSAAEPTGEIFRCDESDEPKDALNRLIVAWDRNDRSAIENSLGPRARKALESLVAKETWAGMRVRLWPSEGEPASAVGYRLKAPGRWSEPDVKFAEPETAVDPVQASARNPTFDTEFTNRSGGGCARHSVSFVKIGGFRGYLVDNADLTELLASLARCAVDTTAGQ